MARFRAISAFFNVLRAFIMFFGMADKVSRLMFDKTKDVLILRMRGVPSMDISALRSLKTLFNDCKKNKVTLVLSHVNEQPMRVLEKAGFIEEIGKENINMI